MGVSPHGETLYMGRGEWGGERRSPGRHLPADVGGPPVSFDARHVPLRGHLTDAPAARGGGRLRPGPRWRRWTLVDLARRRLLAELRDHRSSAGEVGDLVVAELLDPVVSALAALIEHPGDSGDRPLADVLGALAEPAPPPALPEPEPPPDPEPEPPAPRRPRWADETIDALEPEPARLTTVAGRLGCSKSSALHRLETLAKLGLVERLGEGWRATSPLPARKEPIDG